MTITSTRSLDSADLAAADEIISKPGKPEPITDVVDCIEYRRAEHLSTRLRGVLFDLGLDGTVPPNWAVPTGQGVAFESLTLRQADVLVKALEDLEADCHRPVPEPGPNQLSLF